MRPFLYALDSRKLGAIPDRGKIKNGRYFMRYYKIQWYDDYGNTDGSTYEDYQHNLFTTPQQAKDFIDKFKMYGQDYEVVPYTIVTSTPNMTIIRRI